LKEAVSEAQLKEMFATHGEVDHVKKIKDYAFVHFVEREPAIKCGAWGSGGGSIPGRGVDFCEAMEALNGTVLEGIPIEISLAKPQSEKKKVVRGRGRGFGSAARSTGMGGGQFSDYG
uniref:RRM domain-containing protein n=1 Tax=Anisakis simplex TaxID=6269 RepID=A0A0M3JID3_ANISI